MNIKTQLKSNYRYINLLTVFIALLTLSSCAGKTMVKKNEINVSSQMSSSIFITPRPPSEKIVYLEVKNTSDKSIFIKERVEQKIRGAGYQITNNPNQANYILQANILQVSRSDLRANSSMLEEGFGGAIIGAGAASLVSSSNQDVRNAAIIAAGIGLAMDALIDDINYTVVTDIQIRERAQLGETVSQNYSSDLTQGNSSLLSQSSNSNSDWKIYQTRIISTANQVNLEFHQALEPLTEGLANSIGGIF